MNYNHLRILTGKNHPQIKFQFFEKGFRFPENLFQSYSIEYVQNFHRLSHKNMPISQTKGYFENPSYRFLEEPMLFLLALKWNL